MLWCKYVTRRDVTCLVMIHGTRLIVMLIIILITLTVHVAFLTLFIGRQIQKSKTSQDGISVVEFRPPRPSYPPISTYVTNTDVSKRYNNRSHWWNQILFSNSNNRTRNLMFNYVRNNANKKETKEELRKETKHLLRRTERVIKTRSNMAANDITTAGYVKHAESNPWTRRGDYRMVNNGRRAAYQGSATDITSETSETNVKYLPRALRPKRQQRQLDGTGHGHQMSALELHNLDSKTDEDWEPNEDWMTEHLIPTK